MVHLGQVVLDGVLVAHAAEDMLDVPDVLLARRELNAVVGQPRVDLVGHSLYQDMQELGRLLASALHEPDEGELAGAVVRHEQA